MKLIGEGVYNLNELKVIEVTDSFLAMDQEDRKCQSNEPLLNCTTKKYVELHRAPPGEACGRTAASSWPCIVAPRLGHEKLH